MLADRAAQHRVAQLQRVEHRALRDRAVDGEHHLPVHTTEDTQVGGQHDPYGMCGHGSVCTSTDSTAGRSRTIGAHVSPPSGDTYTCPPVVPK